MIISFLTFCLSCFQLFAKGRFTGLNSVWRPLTCSSYGVGALHARALIFSSLVQVDNWVLVYKPIKDSCLFPCGTTPF